jgi:hypothetical protein
MNPGTSEKQVVANTHSTAPNPASEKRVERGAQPIGKRGNRVVVEEPRTGTAEEKAEKVISALEDPDRRERNSEIEERAHAELLAHPLEQKADRRDGSHACSVRGCRHWAGFFSSENPREIAAVVLQGDGIPMPVCRRHFFGGLHGLRARDAAYAALRAAKESGDQAAVSAAREKIEAMPRIFVFKSLANAKEYLRKKFGETEQSPASSRREPSRDNMAGQSAREEARRLLGSILIPRMGGVEPERIERVLRDSAEVPGGTWESFFSTAKAVVKTGFAEDSEEYRAAKAALLLLDNHRHGSRR